MPQAQHMSIAIIINPISGGARPEAARERAAVAAQCLAASREDGEVFVTERRGHARDLAAGAVARGARLVVAWGGDGTVNEIASALLSGEVPLAIVPSGSGNGLASDLGVSRRPETALMDAIRAAPRAIDAGELGGRLFVNLAGIGFDAHVASCFDRDMKGRRGFASYVRISIRELLAYRAETYRIGGDTRNALLITVANGSQFGNGMRIAPGARVDDGKLNLVVFEETSRLRTFAALPRLFGDRAAGARGLTIELIEEATIACDRPMIFHVDGEPIQGGTRLDVRVRPRALRVCVR
jgi:YegS/Rv2252/BmrU family lipid kinase